MVLRRLAGSVVAATLAATLVASPIAAETPSRVRIEFDRVLASFEFSDGGRDFSGQILVQVDSETGVSDASFFYSSGVDVICDNGTPDDPEDDLERQDLIDFTANEAPPSSLSIASNLSAASASATASGQLLTTIDPCLDTQTSSTETIAWEFSLAATGSTTRTTRIDRFPNDDGTVTLQSEKTASRPAAGTISFGGRTLQLGGAQILHVLIVETTH
jgi:hypothetical protein